MDRLEYKLFYSRHLPHIQLPGATLFVTFRLADSIPRDIIQEITTEAELLEKSLLDIKDNQERVQEAYKIQKQLFGKWDTILDRANYGPNWLGQPDIADLVAESLHYRDGRVYGLDSFCIMSNHVHVVFTPLEKEEGLYFALPSIMQSLKGFTAHSANEKLKRVGQFWQHESYDHVVRDTAELGRIRQYVLNNPVKAGLVPEWQEWPWSYCKYDL